MPLILGLILTLLVTPVLIWVAHHYGFLDHPDERKHHQGATPAVGGVAMAIAIAICALWRLAGHEIFWEMFAATFTIVMIGFLDDWKKLPVAVRFSVQGAAALAVSMIAGVKLAQLGDLFGSGTIVLGVSSIPLTVFAVVGVANALNLSDGMDGLAGGLALIATIFIAALAFLSDMQITLDGLLILGGALIGFLFFNMRFSWQPRARVFMGDSGSLMLGFLLAWAAIRVTQDEKNAFPPAAALWFFAIPLWDTVSLMLRRMLKGKSPFHPGRDHLHHILLRVGYTDGQVVHFILLVALTCGLVGLWGWLLGVPDAFLFYGFLGMFALYFAGVRHAWKLMRLIVPLNQHQ
jgi:UDP-GlcNAc:undecaprenyl-phosphate GlcNAc-1-phosphate transferase